MIDNFVESGSPVLQWGAGHSVQRAAPVCAQRDEGVIAARS